VSPLAWVAFVAAGAVGAPARYLLDLAVQDRTRGGYPGGTVVINISGSLILGLITGLALHHGLSQPAKVVLGTGFCGAYTTFSTFSFETVRMIEEGALPEAMRNSFGTLAFGTAAAAAGLIIGTL
jgi:CrcB protein